MKNIKERIGEDRADIVPLYMCDVLWEVCIGTVTEFMEPTDFAKFLNLKPTCEVSLKSDVLVSYMINKIKPLLGPRYRNSWENEMIELCQIKSYSNHFNDAERSERNKPFVKELNDAINTIISIKKLRTST